MISLVIPVYNESKTIFFNIKEIAKSVDNIKHEIIIIDDGSSDDTWSYILKLAREDSTIKGISFSRNFGKEAALIAGLANATGDAVIPLDSDLQDNPKYIKDMVNKWKEGYKIVECVSQKRSKENLIHKICVSIFYKILKHFTGVDMKNARDYRLLDKSVAQEIVKMNDYALFFKGMANFVGFKKTTIYVDTENRKGDTTKFNFKSLARLAINALTTNSNAPLLIPFFVGTVGTAVFTILIIMSLVLKQEIFSLKFLLLFAIFLNFSLFILLRRFRFICWKNLRPNKTKTEIYN